MRWDSSLLLIVSLGLKIGTKAQVWSLVPKWNSSVLSTGHKPKVLVNVSLEAPFDVAL